MAAKRETEGVYAHLNGYIATKLAGNKYEDSKVTYQIIRPE